MNDPAAAAALEAQEYPLLFDCHGEQLLGIVHPAADACATTGCVVVVGGPQYRAGSHRQFVTLARTMAADGCTVLRFDARGMGDSTGALHGFEQITPDIGAAVDALLAAQPRLQRIVLWGLCDGASAALLYLQARRDARIGGLCLLNPWVRSDESLARMRVKHYYRRRLTSRAFWTKLLSGQVAAGAVAGLWRSVRDVMSARSHAAGGSDARFQTRMARAWRRFPGPIWLLLSGNDYTAKEFLELAAADDAWAGLLDERRVSRYDAVRADHTLSDPADEAAAHGEQRRWFVSAFDGTTARGAARSR